MSIEEFSRYINNPFALSLNDIMKLEAASKQFPFFQLSYTLIAKGVHSKAPEIATDSIRKAAVYAQNRNALRKLIENDLEYYVINSQRNEPVERVFDEKKISFIEDEVTREEREKELLQELATKTNTQVQMQKEQLEIIDRFISTEPRIKPIRTAPPLGQNINDDEVEDLSLVSTTMPNNLVTEALARIYIKQGSFEKAIEVYRQLILKKPEKKPYFAEKIDELKRKLPDASNS